MSQEAVLWLFASWVVGAIFGVFFQYLFDRWRNVSEDYELWADIRYMSTASEHASVLGKKVQYLVDDVAMSNPGIVDVYLWSTGKKDVPPANFNSQDLVIGLGVEIVDEMGGNQSPHAAEVKIDLMPDGRLIVKPTRIRKRFARRYRFLVEGKPQLQVTNNISDLEVRSFYGEWSSSTPGQLAISVISKVLIGTAIALFVFMIGSSIVASEWTREVLIPGGWVGTLLSAFGLSMVSGMLLSFSAMMPNRRAQRAIRVLRKSLGRRVLDWGRSSGNYRLDELLD